MSTLLWTAACLLAAPQDPAGAPEAAGSPAERREVAELVRTAVEGVVGVLKQGELPRETRRERVMQIIDPLVDFELLAMLSLGRTHWTAIDDEQRRTFTALFVETLKLSYYEKLELFTDEEVEFEEPALIDAKGSPKYSVLTYILSKGKRIQVAYLLTRREGVLGTGSYKLSQNWVVLGGVRYDLDASRFDQTRIGLGYVDDCLILALNYVTNYAYSGNPSTDHQFLLQMSLRTLSGSSGSQGIGTP